MKKPQFLTGSEAAMMISDNSTVATIGMTLVSASETILKAIENRFLTEGHPNGLTLVHSCGQSDRDRGIQPLCTRRDAPPHHRGTLGPAAEDDGTHSQNKILAYCIPSGDSSPSSTAPWQAASRQNHQSPVWEHSSIQDRRRQNERGHKISSRYRRYRNDRRGRIYAV